MATDRLASGQRIVVEREVGSHVRGVSIYATNAMGTAINEAGKQLSPLVRTMGDALARDGIPRSLLLQTNREIARRAQSAIVGGWHARLPAKSAPYRRGPNPDKDRLSGVLGEVLATDAMIKGTTDRGISFLNTGVLNTQARHWYRVNYGAFGPHANPRRAREYPVSIEGHTLFVLHDEALPAPHSWLPRRFIFEDNMFVPTRGPADVTGGGHRSALFTDIGFQTVAKWFGPIYKRMFTKYVKEQGNRVKMRGKGVVIRKGTTG